MDNSGDVTRLLHASGGNRERVRQVFQAAEALAPAERLGFLEDTCGDDRQLRSEVESLLAAQAESKDLFAKGAVEMAPEPLSEAPPVVGRYEIVREIGAGGMGSVFLANRMGDFRQQVAVKILQRGANLRSIAARFQNERQILAGLQHPNIARILDGGATDDGRPYYVMDYVDGLPLDRYCEERKLPPKERIRLFLPVCAAVQYAHRNLVIHRDLKPANILVTGEGVPILLDFGIAKVLNPDLIAAGEETITGMRIMTPRYASPEQVRGERATTISDVYSLGVILYELLAGGRPYRLEHGTTIELERAIVEQEPIRPAGVDGELGNILAMALRKEPERRYQSADELAGDLRRYLDGLPVSAQPDTFSYRAGKFVRRNRLAVAAAALLAVSLVGGIAATTWQARVAQRRFQEVRTLTNSFLFEFHDAIRDLPGATPARKLVVNKAQEYLNRLAAESGGDPQLQGEAAEAYMRVGAIQSAMGDTRAAMASYRRALSMRQDLLAAEPDNPRRKSELSDTFTTIAQLQMAGGESAASIENARKGLDLAAQALAADPNNHSQRLQLGGRYRQLGNSLLQTGKTQEAQSAFQRSLALAEEAHRLKPGDTETAHSLAIALERAGAGHERTGALTKTIEHYQKALAIRRDLASRHSNNARFALGLAQTHIAIGDAQWDGGNAQAALASYDAALLVIVDLARADPKNSQITGLLGAVHSRRGDALDSAGRWNAALESHRASLAAAQDLVNQDPANASARYNLTISLTKVAQVLLTMDRAPEALEFHQRAFWIRVSLASADPEDIENRRSTAAGHKNLCQAQSLLSRHAEALTNCAKAVQMARAMLDADPRNNLIRVDLSVYLTAYADALRDAGKIEDALKTAWDSVALDERIASAEPGNLEAQGNVAISWERIARLQGDKLANKAEALESARRALAIRRSVARAKPVETRFQKNLAECLILAAAYAPDPDRRTLAAEGLRILQTLATSPNAPSEFILAYVDQLLDAPKELRNAAEASRLAERAIAENAEPSPKLLYTAARAHTAVGDRTKAAGRAAEGLQILGAQATGKLRHQLSQLAYGQ